MPDAVSSRPAFEEWERRMTWMKVATELGQEKDFLALIAAERRDAVEEYKRTKEG